MEVSEQRKILEDFLAEHSIEFPVGARLSHLARRVRSHFPSITEPIWPYPKRWTKNPVGVLAEKLNSIDCQSVKPIERRHYHPVAGSRKSKNSFYHSPAWRKLRYKVLARYGRTCQCCGKSPKSSKAIHVDHIKPISKFPHLRLELSNLQVLCGECNKGKGSWDQTDWRSA